MFLICCILLMTSTWLLKLQAQCLPLRRVLSGKKKKKKPVIAWFVDQLHLVKKRAKEIVLSSNATKSGKIFEATYMLFFSHMNSETIHASLLAVYIHETMQIFHVKGPRLPHWQHNYTWTSTKLHLREHHLKKNLFKNTNMLSNLFLCWHFFALNAASLGRSRTTLYHLSVVPTNLFVGQELPWCRNVTAVPAPLVLSESFMVRKHAAGMEVTQHLWGLDPHWRAASKHRGR